MRLLVVTGTGTAVGKTMTTAALAACAVSGGQRVAVVKPIQTGVLPGEAADLADIERLTGVRDVHEFLRYAEPLAPATAARRVGEAGPELTRLAEAVGQLADRELVILEGAGGVLVRFNEKAEGIGDLALAVQQLFAERHGQTLRPEIVLVTGAALGALHDAAAAAAALAAQGLAADHLVIGDWPDAPGLAERCNLQDLSDYAASPLHGALPRGVGRLRPPEFAEIALRSLSPELGGNLDAPEFISRNAAPLPTMES